MGEAGYVLGVLAAVAAARAVQLWATPNWLLVAGAAAVLLGAVASGLVGAAYHLSLWRTLGRRGALPRGWWWSPSRHHPALTPAERPRVMKWFWLGAWAFGCVCLGALAVLVALFGRSGRT